LKKEEGEDEEVMMNLKEIEDWRGIWIGSDDWIWREILVESKASIEVEEGIE